MIKKSMLLIGVLLAMSCTAAPQQKWIVKVAHDAEQWPSDALTDQYRQVIENCDIRLASLSPSGVPGFYSMTAEKPITAEDKACLLKNSEILSLEEDAIMRPTNTMGNM